MLPTAHFVDRYDAGRRLGVALRKYAAERPLIVLGLPRGGVPVASCVAEELDAPLDIFVVRKLGVPGHEELALGAIASGGARVLNGDVIGELGVPPSAIDRVVDQEQRELARRESLYRSARHFPVIAGETVIVVDDGAATGASMRVAVIALRQLGPRAIIVAIPVASHDALSTLESVADECICLVAPEPFYGVGLWYEDFSETSDVEVRVLLADARRRWETAAPLHAEARI
jgi:putative phosphoribosyl transferase